MKTKKLIELIIPPSDSNHRNGFSNSDIIDQLTEQEKKLVEDALIKMLMANTKDTLVIETLASLKSIKSLPLMYEFLENCSDLMARIIVSTSIFEINKDDNMIKRALVSFNELDNNKDAYYVYKIAPAFYYLIKFQSSEVKGIIEKYINHKEYIVSYNAKQALGI